MLLFTLFFSPMDTINLPSGSAILEIHPTMLSGLWRFGDIGEQVQGCVCVCEVPG
jgi:hypothetical protein